MKKRAVHLLLLVAVLAALSLALPGIVDTVYGHEDQRSGHDEPAPEVRLPAKLELFDKTFRPDNKNPWRIVPAPEK
jgi:hypothetical protein